MKDRHLEHAFPKVPKAFHNRVDQTLNKIIKEEAQKDMKHKFFSKKVVIIAAAAVLVVGTGAFATGKITSYVSSSSTIPTYTSIPSNQELQSKYGFSPIVLDNFTNGYKFKKICTVNAKGLDESGNSVKTSKDLDITYQNGKDSIMLYAKAGPSDDADVSTLDTYKGIAIKYTSYDNKCVPADYKLTEQDKKDEKSGKYVFSYGSDKVEVSKVQYIAWTKNGVSYSFTGMNSPLAKADLDKMAHEVIDAK